jgi:hypothetical protein
MVKKVDGRPLSTGEFGRITKFSEVGFKQKMRSTQSKLNGVQPNYPFQFRATLGHIKKPFPIKTKEQKENPLATVILSIHIKIPSSLKISGHSKKTSRKMKGLKTKTSKYQ